MHVLYSTKAFAAVVALYQYILSSPILSVPLFADSAAAKTQSHIIFLSFSRRSLYSDPNCNFVLNM